MGNQGRVETGNGREDQNDDQPMNDPLSAKTGI